MKKILSVVSVLIMVAGLTGCSHKEGPNTVSVGTISGPETTLMQVAKKVAKKEYGLNVKIVTFSDYVTPNTALADGEIDANAFQHLPYLKAQIKARGFQLVSVGKTFLYPMGIYSKKIDSLHFLKEGAKVAVPNDPSNEARALLLLQKAHLITLKKDVGINATIHDIVKNPKNLKFITLDAAEIPRALHDVTLAAINTNYAVPAGLSPAKDALIEEGTDSPYVNIIAARKDNANTRKVRDLVHAFQSLPVVLEAKKLFGANAIAGFKVHP